MRVGIFGKGRLGSAVAAMVDKEPDLELAFCLGREGAPDIGVDLVLDVSAAAAVGGHLGWAREAGADIVVGTTGWDRSLVEGAGSWGIGVMTAPNFSIAVAFMRRAALALGRFAAMDGGYDLSVTERHHRAKLDAPSGTAILLAGALASGCPRYKGWMPAPGPGTGLPIASIRGGGEVGFHELRCEGANESLAISHQARSRDLFAAGALRALRWIRGRKGLWSFDDLAAEIMGSLFLP